MEFLGIDIGTTSICGICTGPDCVPGKSFTVKNDSRLKGKPWENIQDPGRIIESVLETVDAASAGHAEIGSVGLSGQMHGILYVDVNGKAVSPLYTWQDGRGDLPYKEGLSYAGWLSAVTGCRLSTGYGGVTHFYNLVNGLVPPQAAYICTIMDYAAMVLSGAVRPVMDPSNAASLGFFDLKSGRFDLEAIEKAGMDPGIFPEVAPCLKTLGYYKGARVVSAIGDNQAGFIGSVPCRERSIHVTVGTSSQISVWTDEYVSIPGLDTRPLPGGGYILVGAALCGGSSLALLNGLFGEAVSFFTGETVSEDVIYEKMGSVPYRPSTQDDLEVNTVFRGTRENPAVRGRIGNMSMSNLTVGDLVLGFNRGVADELYNFYINIPSSIRDGKDLLVGSGNGIRKNKLLRRALEERFGCPLTVSECTEEAACGACICGMKAYHG